MQTNILWTGREYYSLENCRIDDSEGSVLIESTIVGKYGNDLYQVSYQIRTNEYWETVLADVSFFKNNVCQHLRLESDGMGHWLLNGEADPALAGCIDVDLPLTPFTNTLPIRRLNMHIGDEQSVKVVYLDLLENRLVPVAQKYTRLSETVFHYENVPNDFEADITVDRDGLIVDYPGLFVRTTRNEYHSLTE